MPLAALTAALLSAEWIASRSVFALALDAALMAAFVALSPAAWRGLCAGREGAAAARGWALFVGLAAAVVVAILGLPPLVGEAWTYVGDPRALGISIALFVVGGWGLGRDIELEREAARAHAQASRRALEAEQAQLLAVRAHLDPHFLFNTLNAIAEWCREDPAVAERATLALAALLRRLFDALQRPTWTLADELELLQGLAGLYAIRDAERYVFHLPEQTVAAEIPPLLVLPLFENAIKHGPAAGHDGLVSLEVAEDDGALLVTIENPGRYGGRREGGRGLEMVERRLALTYGDRASLVVEGRDGRTRATLAVPRAW